MPEKKVWKSKEMGDITIFWYAGKDRPPSAECLARCAAVYANEPAKNASVRWKIQKTQKGKPYFPADLKLHCSVTHSGEYWLGAFSSQPVGIDLQIHQPCKKEALSRRFFHVDENAFLAKNDYSEFYSVWTGKESFVKFTGEGICGTFSQFRVASPEGLLSSANGVQFRWVPFRRGYTLCVCAANIGKVLFQPGE